jgi:flagellar motor switch protein FliG
VPQKFTGVQKAAILLMQAGKEHAAAILRSMREQEVAEIMAEVARLHHLEINEIEEVIGEFQDIYTARSHIAQGGYSTARELLEASFGGQKADEILDNLGVTMVAAPFEFLRRADTRQVLIQQSDFAQAGGLQTLVDILNSSDRTTERLILEGLDSEDAELADEVRNRMFVFEDIVGLDDRSVQLVLRSVDAKELAVALKGVDQKVRNKIMKNMSERAAANLAEEIQLLGPVKLKTVEEAQASVVRAIRVLEESGQIDMSRGSDELVV